MKDEVEKIRERLQDLHDQHTTGFVDDAQYAQALAVLERRLADAVTRAASAETASTAAPVISAPSAAAGRRPPPARSRWPLWLAAAALVHVLAIAIYAWSTSHDSSTAPGASTKPADATPLQASAPSGPGTAPAAPAAVIESTALQTPGPTAGDTSISGTVTLAPALVGRAQATDTLFVYAHALDGPAVPLAVLRKQVKDLPLDFKLDDSMTMWSTAKLSTVSRVIVTARISKSGDGKARKGDLQGDSPAVSAGAAEVQIEIGTLIEK